jgi:hypothetical protein
MANSIACARIIATEKMRAQDASFPSGFSLYFRAALLKIPAVSQSPIYLHSTGDERHYLCYIAHLSFQI